MKRMISALLIVVMMLSLVPQISVLAEQPDFEVVSATQGTITPEQNITAQFSESLDAESVSSDNVKLYKDGVPVELSNSQISVNGSSIIVDYDTEVYSIYIFELCHGIKSDSGKTISEDISFEFTVDFASVTSKITHQNFMSAMYLPSDPDDAGQRSSGWMYPYAGGVYRELYCKIDISSRGNIVPEETYLYFYGTGTADFELYEINGEFTPGISKYSELPQAGKQFASHAEERSSVGYFKIDVSEYVKKICKAGATSFDFVLKQGSGSTVAIENEACASSYPNEVPYLETTYIPVDVPAIKSTNPKAFDTNFNGGMVVLDLTHQVKGVSGENFELIRVSDNSIVEVEDKNIIYESHANKILLDLGKILEGSTVYDLKISGLETVDKMPVNEKKIRFKTGYAEGSQEFFSENIPGSFVNIKNSDEFDGNVVVSGKLFNAKNTQVLCELKKVEDGTVVGTATADSNENGYFSFEISPDDIGEVSAYVSSQDSIYGGIISKNIYCYSTESYNSVWSVLCSRDSASIEGVIKDAFEMFAVFKTEEEIFDIDSSLASYIATEDYGDYNAANIKRFIQKSRLGYIVNGFSNETDGDKLVDAVVMFGDEAKITSLENYNFYKSFSDEYKLETANLFIKNRKDSFDTTDKVAEAFGNAINSARLEYIFDSIQNATNYNDVVELILNEENTKFLQISEGDISKFEKNKKNAGKYLVGKRFSDFDEFKDEFDKALEEKPSKTSDKSSSGGSSSKGSSGGSFVFVTETKPNDNINSTPIQTEPKVIFTDLDGYDWAKDKIELLYKMGIIDGIGEGVFAPGSNLTREQFAKLLFEALEFEIINENPGFSDVESDDWFYPYVATIKAKGITNGKGSAFGVGDFITREDIAVMIVRTLSAAGYKILNKELTFSDADEVSQYARESVAFLSWKEIVTGMQDGTFKPKNYATRAEAAVMIDRLLNYVKNTDSSVWTAPSTSLEHVQEPSQAQILADIKNNLCKKDLKHPYIFASYDKLVEVKENVAKGEEGTKKIYTLVKESADEILKMPVIVNGGRVSQGHLFVDERVITLMITYFVEDDEKYLNRAIEEFNELKKVTIWSDSAQLANTMTAEAIAVCYDWLYDYISQEDRAWALKNVKENSVDIAYKYYEDPSVLSELKAEWSNMNIFCGRDSYNHATYNNSNLMISALMLAPDYPEYSAFVIYNNLYNIQPYLQLVGSAGGCAESVGYYAYTSERIINMLAALNTALGTMYDYDRYYGFRTTSYYPLYMYGAGPFCFGDTVARKAQYDVGYLYFPAKTSKNAELLSVVIDRLRATDQIGKVLLWYDAGEWENIEENTVLSYDGVISPETETSNIVSFRNSWDINEGFYASMYAGQASANGHSDATSGAFQIDAFGEMFVHPMGQGNYDYPGYWDNTQNGQRWNWYEKRPEGGNCIVINPSYDVGQDVSKVAKIDGFATSEGAGYAYTDLSEVYKNYVTSYKRGMRVFDNRSKIVVQDELSMESPSNIFWSVNTPAEIKFLSNDSAILEIENKKMLVRVWANVPFEFYEMPAEKLATSPQFDEQKIYPNLRKLAININKVKELQLMVEFTPIITEMEISDTISEFIPISSWIANESLVKKPTLEKIMVNGELIKDYSSTVYNQTFMFDSMPEENPVITYENPNGYEVNIIYPEGEQRKAVIEVINDYVKAFYEIVFLLKPKTFNPDEHTQLKFESISATSDDGNVAENVGDGNMYTRWSSDVPKCQLNIDLGAVKDITTIGMAFYYGDSRQTYFEILVSDDGKEWTKVIASGTSSGTTSDFEYWDINKKARYIRYVGNGNNRNDWNSVVEMTAFCD